MARAASATARGIFPGELPGEEDCDSSDQQRRNNSNSHSSIRMEDTLLARSFCQSTSLQQLVKHCIYLMYLFQIQISCPWFGLAGSSHSTAVAAASQTKPRTGGGCLNWKPWKCFEPDIYMHGECHKVCSSRLLTWQRDAASAQHQRRVPPVPPTRRGKMARTPTARAASAAEAANLYTVP